MKFKSVFDKHDRINTCSGDRFIDELQLVIRPDGSHEFINTGKRDIYMEIQSHKNSCDIHWILDHFANDPIGLSERLESKKAQFIDTLDFPQTYAEMLQRCIDARNFFYQLDPSIREKFNFSVDEFIAQIGTDKWNDLIMPKEIRDDVRELEKTLFDEAASPSEKTE